MQAIENRLPLLQQRKLLLKSRAQRQALILGARRAMVAAGPTTRFAEAIFQRYSGLIRAVTPKGLLFRKPWRFLLLRQVRHKGRLSFTSQLHHKSHLNFAPHLHPTLFLRSAAQPRTNRAVALKAPVPLLPSERPLQRILHLYGVTRTQEQARRASSARRQETRREPVKKASLPSPTRVPGSSAPVTRVFRQGPILQDEARVKPDSMPDISPDSDWAPVIGQRQMPALPPPFDLRQLTDQVIQVIDQRIIAQRERLGRQ